jgi:hypothetical protein
MFAIVSFPFKHLILSLSPPPFFFPFSLQIVEWKVPDSPASADINDMDTIWKPPNSVKQTAAIRESKTNEISFKPNEKTFKTANHLTCHYKGQYKMNTSSVPTSVKRFGPPQQEAFIS